MYVYCVYEMYKQPHTSTARAVGAACIVCVSLCPLPLYAFCAVVHENLIVSLSLPVCLRMGLKANLRNREMLCAFAFTVLGACERVNINMHSVECAVRHGKQRSIGVGRTRGERVKKWIAVAVDDALMNASGIN